VLELLALMRCVYRNIESESTLADLDFILV